MDSSRTGEVAIRGMENKDGIVDLDTWVDCHGVQGIIYRVDELRSVILGPGDFQHGDLEHWPLIRRSVLDKRAREKLERRRQ